MSKVNQNSIFVTEAIAIDEAQLSKSMQAAVYDAELELGAGILEEIFQETLQVEESCEFMLFKESFDCSEDHSFSKKSTFTALANQFCINTENAAFKMLSEKLYNTEPILEQGRFRRVDV